MLFLRLFIRYRQPCLITEYLENNVEYTEGVYETLLPQHLQLAIKGMANLHARFWGAEAAKTKQVFPITNSTVYLFELFMVFSWSKAARKLLVQSWCYMNEPQTILHGDARIGNMMFPNPDTTGGRFAFIDWQAVRKGKATFDLAYFLVLSLTPEHRQQVEDTCLENYYATLVENGVSNYTFHDLKTDYRHACICILVLLSLPLLSGEASAEGQAALYFAYGMGIWRERMRIKFTDFDYAWMARQYNLTEEECRNAINEMLEVISNRLNKIETTRLS